MGRKKIPDNEQVRNDDFTLIGYMSIKPGSPLLRLEKLGFRDKEEEFRAFIEKMPFGKLQKFE